MPATEAGVSLVTGDTKVVDRGKGDQIFITTSGIGVVPEGRHCPFAPPGPAIEIIVSGTDRRSRHRHHVRARGNRI